MASLMMSMMAILATLFFLFIAHPALLYFLGEEREQSGAFISSQYIVVGGLLLISRLMEKFSSSAAA